MTRGNLNRHTLHEGSQKWLKQVPIKYNSYNNADEILTSCTIKIERENITDKSLFSKMAHLISYCG